MLVNLWEKNIGVLESPDSYKIWTKITAAVHSLGTKKLLSNVKIKCKTLKAHIKEQMKTTKKTGAPPSFSPNSTGTYYVTHSKR